MLGLGLMRGRKEGKRGTKEEQMNKSYLFGRR